MRQRNKADIAVNELQEFSQFELLLLPMGKERSYLSRNETRSEDDEPRRDWGKGVMVLCTHFVRPARYGQSSRTFRRQTAFVGRALCYVPSRHSLSSRQDSPTQRAPSSMLASEGFDELTLFRSYEAKSDPSQEDELALGIPDKYALRLSRARLSGRYILWLSGCRTRACVPVPHPPPRERSPNRKELPAPHLKTSPLLREALH